MSTTRATMHPVFAALAALAMAAALLVASPTTTPAQAQTDRTPIIFVHGYASTSSVFDTMISRFESDGWSDEELVRFEYDWGQSNATTAEELADEVDRVLADTGASEVSLVTHSMGGLSSRYFISELGGEDSVDAWVSLGGPNNGTLIANLCTLIHTSCQEMTLRSAFLSDLNADDPTPGDVRYGTWWSRCDYIINPASSTVLDGADNNRVWCTGHFGLLLRRSVYTDVRDYVS